MKWFVQIILDQAATDDQAEAFARIGFSALCNRADDTTELRIYRDADDLGGAVNKTLAEAGNIMAATGLSGQVVQIDGCTEQARGKQLLAELVD